MWTPGTDRQWSAPRASWCSSQVDTASLAEGRRTEGATACAWPEPKGLGLISRLAGPWGQADTLLLPEQMEAWVLGEQGRSEVIGTYSAQGPCSGRGSVVCPCACVVCVVVVTVHLSREF